MKPYDVKIKVKGNVMTQKYYIDRLLPIYVQAIENKAQQEPREWLLQEDRDPVIARGS